MTPKRMTCCDARDMGTSYHGGRPYQCVHDYQAAKAAPPPPPQGDTIMAKSKSKRCPGVPLLGIDAHTAPLSDFTRDKSLADGHAVQCRSHGNAYQAVWRKAKAAGLSVRDYVAAGQPDLPTAAPKVADKARAADTVVDGTDTQRSELADLEARVAAAGGAGTDEGQALLAQDAKASADARREHRSALQRQRRAAAKAAEQAQA